MDSRNKVTWGPVYDDDLYRIEFPNSDDWVEVKRYITEGDRAAAQDAAKMRYRGIARRNQAEGGGDTSFDVGTFNLVLLQRVVKNWSFVRNGESIPVTPQTVAMLPGHTRDYVMQELDRLNPQIGEDENLGSGKASQPSSEETVTAPLS